MSCCYFCGRCHYYCCCKMEKPLRRRCGTRRSSAVGSSSAGCRIRARRTIARGRGRGASAAPVASAAVTCTGAGVRIISGRRAVTAVTRFAVHDVPRSVVVAAATPVRRVVIPDHPSPNSCSIPSNCSNPSSIPTRDRSRVDNTNCNKDFPISSSSCSSPNRAIPIPNRD